MPLCIWVWRWTRYTDELRRTISNTFTRMPPDGTSKSNELLSASSIGRHWGSAICSWRGKSRPRGVPTLKRSISMGQSWKRFLTKECGWTWWKSSCKTKRTPRMKSQRSKRSPKHASIVYSRSDWPTFHINMKTLSSSQSLLIGGNYMSKWGSYSDSLWETLRTNFSLKSRICRYASIGGVDERRTN